jgi:N-methylhydantoinase A
MAAAYGIHTVANANMMRVVKAVTTYRGRDPRDFTLFAYGGNGGVHAIDLARVLQIGRVVVPVGAGVFSAIGLLFSAQDSTWTQPFHHVASSFPAAEAQAKYALMAKRIQMVLAAAPEKIGFRYEADVRFVGQAFEITVPFAAAPHDEAAVNRLCKSFTAEHLARYGHAFSGRFPVEIVNLRLTGRLLDNTPPHKMPGTGRELSREIFQRPAYFGPAHGMIDTPILGRARLDPAPRQGPMIIEEYEGTIVVPPDCTARRDDGGNVVIDLPERAQ